MILHNSDSQKNLSSEEYSFYNVCKKTDQAILAQKTSFWIQNNMVPNFLNVTHASIHSSPFQRSVTLTLTLSILIQTDKIQIYSALKLYSGLFTYICAYLRLGVCMVTSFSFSGLFILLFLKVAWLKVVAKKKYHEIRLSY